MAEEKTKLEDYQPGFVDESLQKTVKKNNSVRVNSYDTYVSRNVSEDTLNWNTVAKTITGQLNAIAKDRKDRKQNIVDQTQKAIGILENIDDYTNANVNNAVIDMAQGIKEQLLIRNKLVESGAIKPVDYLKFVEAAKSQMKTWGVASKNFETDYVAHLERQENNTAAADETFNAESYYGFGNMNEVKSFVSPTGKAYLVKVDPKTGAMPDFDKEPGKFLPVQTMNGRNKFTAERIQFDIREQVKIQTAEMGVFLRESLIDTETFEGGVIKLTKKGLAALNDPYNKDIKAKWLAYKKSVENRIVGEEDDQRLANILVQSQSGYNYATSVKQYKEKYGDDLSKMIILDMTNMPPTYTFGKDGKEEEKMRAEAKRLVNEEIDFQIGSSEEQTLSTEPLSSETRTNPGGNITPKDKRDATTDFAVRLVNGDLSAINDLESTPAFNQIQQIEMTKRDGTVIDMRSADYDVNEVDNIYVSSLNKDGNIIRLKIETKQKDRKGAFIMVDVLDSKGKPTGKKVAKSKSSREITGEILTKIGVDARDRERYLEEYDNRDNAGYGEFKGVPSFNRNLGVLSGTGSLEVTYKKQKYALSTIVQAIFDGKNDDEDMSAIIAEIMKVDDKDADAAEKKRLKQQELIDAKWKVANNFVNEKYNGLLQGKKFRLEKTGDALSFYYDNTKYSLKITAAAAQGNFPALMDEIDTKLTSLGNQTKAPGDEIFENQ